MKLIQAQKFECLDKLREVAMPFLVGFETICFLRALSRLVQHQRRGATGFTCDDRA